MSIAVVFYEGLLRLASGSFVLLLIASAVLLLTRQPARRIRVIQWALAGLVVLPCLMLLPGYPRLAILPALPLSDSTVDGRGEGEAVPVDEPLAAPVASGAPQDVPFDGIIVTQRVLREDGTIETTEVPVFAAPLPDAVPPAERADVATGDVVIDEGDSPGTTAPAIAWRLPADYRVWIVAAYATGSIVMLLWSLLGLAAVRRLIRSARAAPAECRVILRAVGGPRSDRVAVLVSSRAAQPCAVLWRPTTIILPEKLVADADPRALRWALAHEWSHVERGDLATWTASGIVRWFTFYQPLVWWLRWQLQLCQDYVADTAAARAGGMPEDYAEFLTTSSFTRPTLAAGLGIGGRISDLRRRVVMLVEQRRPLETTSPRRWNLAALPIAAAVVLVAGGLAQKQSKPSPTKDVSVAEETPTTVAPSESSDSTANKKPRAVVADKKKQHVRREKPPALRKIAPGDVLTIDLMDNLESLQVPGLQLLLPRNTTLVVDPEGRVSLGSQYATTTVAGETLAHAQRDISKTLLQSIRMNSRIPTSFERALDSMQINVRLGFANKGLSGDGFRGTVSTAPTPKTYVGPSATRKTAPAAIAAPFQAQPSASPFSPAARTQHERIQPGDVLHIEAEPPEAELDRESTVEADGNLALGVRFGRVDVAGKTLTEAEEAIRAVVAKRYRDPRVQVTYAQQTPDNPFVRQTEEVHARKPHQLEALVKKGSITQAAGETAKLSQAADWNKLNASLVAFEVERQRHKAELRVLESKVRLLEERVHELREESRRTDK